MSNNKGAGFTATGEQISLKEVEVFGPFAALAGSGDSRKINDLCDRLDAFNARRTKKKGG